MSSLKLRDAEERELTQTVVVRPALYAQVCNACGQPFNGQGMLSLVFERCATDKRGRGLGNGASLSACSVTCAASLAGGGWVGAPECEPWREARLWRFSYQDDVGIVGEAELVERWAAQPEQRHGPTTFSLSNVVVRGDEAHGLMSDPVCRVPTIRDIIVALGGSPYGSLEPDAETMQEALELAQGAGEALGLAPATKQWVNETIANERSQQVAPLDPGEPEESGEEAKGVPVRIADAAWISGRGLVLVCAAETEQVQIGRRLVLEIRGVERTYRDKCGILVNPSGYIAAEPEK